MRLGHIGFWTNESPQVGLESHNPEQIRPFPRIDFSIRTVT